MEISGLSKQPLIMKNFLNWFKNLMSTQCPKCKVGRVSHSHSEPHGRTTIEVYECDKCNSKFV